MRRVAAWRCGLHETVKEHYIPVVDDVFLTSDYDTIFKGAAEIDINETSAGVMHVEVSVGLREVEKALGVATAAMNEKDYVRAQTALGDVFKGAIYDEEEVDDPMLAISENIALAKSFVKHERYDSARLTLRQVRERLDKARNSELSSLDQSSVDHFLAELDAIRENLRKKDPTLTQRMGTRLSALGHSVKGRFK